MKFVNVATPYLAIFIPPTGETIRFQGGILEVDEDDPRFPWVKAEAERNPAISVHEKVNTCVLCGEVFTGKMAAARLGAHRKEIHFDTWQAEKDAEAAAEREVQIKSRSGVFCDICVPLQEFPTKELLAEHTLLLHANAPALTESGETVGGDPDAGGAAVDTGVPAATPSGSDS